MKRDINKFTQGPYDLLVIGGGINGAAVANMAALNGLRVSLLEKGDFASGTSSKSTKLLHGGLRYLENFEFDLVKESLKERFIQLKSAPHLAKRLSFIIPVYKGDQRPLWMMKFGVQLYDFLSGKYKIEKHRVLTAEEVSSNIPGIEKENLLGGILYFDAQMDDARLCLENVLSAVSQGADVANYVEVKFLIKEMGKTIGVEAFDFLNNQRFQVLAKKIVCAVGPWTNLFIQKERSQAPQKVRTTKGVHIVYKDQFCKHAVFTQTKKGGRMFFIIPWKGHSLIGTTDTDFDGNPDDVKVEQQDIDYLANEAKRIFPWMEFNENNVITTFAGLRPLVFNENSPSRISRKHKIEQSYSGVNYIMGGKYTTYRKIAEDYLRLIVKKKLVETQDQYPLYGGGKIKDDVQQVAQQFGVHSEVVQSLMDMYGTRYMDVLALCERDDDLKESICTCTNTIKAQVVYSIETELAVKEEDIITRRLGLEYQDCETKQCRHVVQEILSAKSPL